MTMAYIYFKISPTNIEQKKQFEEYFVIGEQFTVKTCYLLAVLSKKVSNDQELVQSEPKSCPRNQHRHNTKRTHG